MISDVIFCSDLHLGHALAAEKRGFTTIDEHDHAVIASVAQRANKRTVVWIVGDVCMREEKLSLLNQIPGRKILVRGNHDIYDTSKYAKYFEEIYGIIKYKRMWISHCPIHPQELYGRINVHGHIHKNTKSSVLPPPYFNLNWDFLRGAVSLDEIRNTPWVKDMMSKGITNVS